MPHSFNILLQLLVQNEIESMSHFRFPSLDNISTDVPMFNVTVTFIEGCLEHLTMKKPAFLPFNECIFKTTFHNLHVSVYFTFVWRLSCLF